jgi:LysR family transcriptional regulator, hydrogen peroxide-inducible genes activator
MPAAHDLSIRQLQYVVAVADTLGFHRAAERCHVSQPTLSAQVQQLEDVVGVRIFERDRRGVLLTPAGEAIVARARRVLLALDELLGEAERVSDPFAGTFRIGVIPTIAPYLLPDLTPAITAQHPRLRLVFREEKTADVVRGLHEGRLDAGLVALEAEIGDLRHAEVMRDPFVVALPKAHALSRTKRVSPADLEDAQVLLLDDGHCFRAQALSVCAKAGATETDFRATSLSTLAQMVSAGAGITLLPSIAVPVENRRAQLAIRPFAAPVPCRTIALVWRSSSPFGDAFEALAATMRKEAKRRPREDVSGHI